MAGRVLRDSKGRFNGSTKGFRRGLTNSRGFKTATRLSVANVRRHERMVAAIKGRKSAPVAVKARKANGSVGVVAAAKTSAGSLKGVRAIPKYSRLSKAQKRVRIRAVAQAVVAVGTASLAGALIGNSIGTGLRRHRSYPPGIAEMMQGGGW